MAIRTFKKYIFSVAIAFSSLAYAEVTYTYLVPVALTPRSTVSGLGHKTSEQPLYITKILTAPNTNYVLLEVTPADVSEGNTLVGLENSNRIRLLWTDEIVHYNMGGLQVADRVHTSVSNFPVDYFKTWISSN